MTSMYDEPGIVASRCMGCSAGIIVLTHDCGGSRVPSAELGWRCDCQEAECRRRQAGDWTNAKRPALPNR